MADPLDGLRKDLDTTRPEAVGTGLTSAQMTAFTRQRDALERVLALRDAPHKRPWIDMQHNSEWWDGLEDALAALTRALAGEDTRGQQLSAEECELLGMKGLAYLAGEEEKP